MARPNSIPDGLRPVIAQVGLACFLASTSRSLRDISDLEPWRSDSLTLVVVANASLIAALAVVALAYFVGKKERIPLGLSGLGVLLVCAGFAGALASTAVPAHAQLALGCACGVAFGVGGAIGFSSWLAALEHDGDQATYTVIAGSLISGLVGLVLANPGMQELTAPTCIGLAAFSFVCLSMLARDARAHAAAPSPAPAARTTAAPSPAPRYIAVAKEVWRPALCVGTLGMISIVSRFMVVEQSTDLTLVIATVGEIIPCLVLLVLLALPSFNTDITAVYKLLFPAVALLFLMLTFFGGAYAPALAVVSGSAYQLCMMLLIPQALGMARRLGAPAFAVYAVCSIIIYLAIFLGYPVIPLGKAYFDYALYPVVAVLMLYILSMGLIAGLTANTAGGSGKRGAGQDHTGTGRIPAGAETIEVPLPPTPGQPDKAPLSSRETEILKLILAGRDVPHIATALCLSKNTVRTHVKSLYAKYEVHSRQELINKLTGCQDDVPAPDPRA